VSQATRRRGRGLAVTFAILAVLAVLVVGFGGVVLYARGQLEAPASSHGQVVTVDVRPGESLDQLADDLATKGVVRSAFWFKWFARFKGLADHLHVGRFRLDTGMGASAVIQRLEGVPDVTTVRIVLTEGLTARQMAARVERSGVGVTAAQYMAEVDSGTFDEPFLAGRPSGSSLEGFLFPDTYEFPKGTGAHQIVKAQLDDFARRAGALLQAPPNGMSAYQLVVVASIIEREAQFDNDRPLVASAIYNRLGATMPLQSDATVEYGLGITGREPTADELKQPSPYNTYLHTGLPPTPIANPGLASLQAAAHPAKTGYYFWVADGCGHNHYATTEAQHEQQNQQFLNSPCPTPS
jgi:UPF0755 protein